MGADRPPNGARQRSVPPLKSHESGRPVSEEMPSRLGPRASGQSPRATRRGACAQAGAARLSETAMTAAKYFSIGFSMLLEYVAAGKAAYERCGDGFEGLSARWRCRVCSRSGLEAQSHRGVIRGRVAGCDGRGRRRRRRDRGQRGDQRSTCRPRAAMPAPLRLPSSRPGRGAWRSPRRATRRTCSA